MRCCHPVMLSQKGTVTVDKREKYRQHSNENKRNGNCRQYFNQCVISLGNTLLVRLVKSAGDAEWIAHVFMPMLNAAMS